MTRGFTPHTRRDSRFGGNAIGKYADADDDDDDTHTKGGRPNRRVGETHQSITCVSTLYYIYSGFLIYSMSVVCSSIDVFLNHLYVCVCVDVFILCAWSVGQSRRVARRARSRCVSFTRASFFKASWCVCRVVEGGVVVVVVVDVVDVVVECEGWFGGDDCAFVVVARVGDVDDDERDRCGRRRVVLGFSPTRGSRARGRGRGCG